MVGVDNIGAGISYDLQAFFKEFTELKISSITERAELKPSLLRQYASGNKFPSIDHQKKNRSIKDVFESIQDL